MKLILRVCLLVIFHHLSSAEEETRQKPGFFLALPSTLISGTNEKACLSLHNVALPVGVTVILETNSSNNVLERKFDAEYSCFELQVPSQINRTGSADVEIQIKTSDGTTLSGHTSESIPVSQLEDVTFVQTDKQEYKPGDVLKIRIFVLNKDFLAGNEQKISLVKIRNPEDITVAVWKDVRLKQGLVHLEYKLSEETVEGQWKITANGEEKIVEIKKYVLPRFKVDLRHPEELYVKAEKTEIEVCAKYPYGQPLMGTALLDLRRTVEYYAMTEKNITKSLNLKSGCAVFTFSKEEMDLQNYTWWWMPLKIRTIVTEAGTNQTEETEGEIRVVMKQEVLIEINGEEDIFRTGLPYEAKVTVKNVEEPLENNTLKICYHVITGEKRWGFGYCSNFTADSKQSVSVTVPPLASNVHNIGIRAQYADGQWVRKDVHRIFSASGGYVYLRQSKGDLLQCENFQHFTVYYTVNEKNLNQNLTFYYMIKSHNEIHHFKEITTVPKNIQTFEEHSWQDLIGESSNYTDYSTNLASFNISFELDRQIPSKYKLLVYYLLSDGSIVAGTKEIALEPCLPNKVDIEWSKQQFYPGEEATLSIKTSSKSLCSISTVDEATKYKFADNFNVRTLVERLTINSERPNYYGNYYRNFWKCSNDAINENEGWKMEAEVYTDEDTSMILQGFGTVFITNFEIPKKPCTKIDIPQGFGYGGGHYYDSGYHYDRTVPIGASARSGVAYFESSPAYATTVRSFFPETWLWELVPVDVNGDAQIVRNIPHSITNWVSNVICISPTEGIGLSDIKDLITFQPFFVDVITPYSIKRGEILHLAIKAFNYLNHSIPVHVSVLQQEGLEILEDRDSTSKCIDGSNSMDFIYRIRSTVIGKINITVVGETDASYPEECGKHHVTNKRDVVRKQLLVEPEGFPVEVVKSELLCVNASHPKNNVSWTLQLATGPNVVPDSARTKVIFNSDILGSTIENLETLLTVPTGCGEQVMSKLAPNLQLLRYLNATKQLTEATKNRAIENINIGYQKILTYKHADGSFSAFGERDGAGSMFLTAFVVRTLMQAKPYIYVDDSVIERAVKWIFEHQSKNGCFPSMNHLFQSLGNDETETSAVLTSYVLISLKEVGVKIPELNNTKAISCLSDYTGNATYPLALVSYALLLSDSQVEGKKSLDSLMTELTSKKEKKKVERYYYYYDSHEIETHGYALLSLLKQNDGNSIAHATNLVQWLSTKMSPRGGFTSTQDTVVALDGLSRYAAKVWAKPNVKVHLAVSGREEELRIADEDQLKLSTYQLQQAEDTVQIAVSGEGCILAQAVLTYNVFTTTQAPAFNITVQPELKNKEQSCSTELQACVAYSEHGTESNMAVMEVTIPSGYGVDEESLSKLLQEGENGNKIRRYEVEQNKVILYYAGLTNETVCTSVTIIENQKVENRTAATVNVFDYYKPENRASIVYELQECK